jgi:CBS domain-containing protein
MSSVEDYITTNMVACSSKVSLSEVAKTMIDEGISSVAVTDEENKEVVGILTERDVVKSVAKGGPNDDIIAESLMSPPTLSIRSDQPIQEAALLMIRNKVRHLFVEDPIRHKVIGIITTTDLARFLKSTMKRTNTNIEEEDAQQQERQEELRSSELLTEVWELYF